MTAIGSLCSGYGGLDMAAEQLTGGHTVWMSDLMPAASTLLAYRYPNVPNIGNFVDYDWSTVAPIDVLTAGFPCQDVSLAGKRAGLRAGTRTGIWSHIAVGISVLRPQLVLLENVSGLLSAGADSDVEPCPWCLGDPRDQPHLRALGAVLGDLAALGYDAEWRCLRASDVGAPHGRNRCFIAATDTQRGPRGTGRADAVSRSAGGRDSTDSPLGSPAATPDSDDVGSNGGRLHGSGQRWRPEPTDGDQLPPDPDREGLEVDGPIGDDDAAQRADVRDRGAPAHADRNRLEGGRPEQYGSPLATTQVGQRAAADSDRRRFPQLPELDSDTDAPLEASDNAVGSLWGIYGAAIHRWELILGRPAPEPTTLSRRGGRQLSARFVEWIMGLPAGWVTDVPGLTRNQQLTLLGNGVVPQQALAAYSSLLSRELVAA